MSRIEKRLGRIASVRFGFGGYGDAEFGLSLTFQSKSDSWGVSTFISGGWSERVEVTEYTKWSEEDRTKKRVNMVKKIDRTLKEAKVTNIADLKGKPVEVTFKDSTLSYWRILEEVL